MLVSDMHPDTSPFGGAIPGKFHCQHGLQWGSYGGDYQNYVTRMGTVIFSLSDRT